MKILRNEKGFALLFVLILAMIALLMTISMLSMVSRGSYVSGQQKRFRTAVEAGRGGMEAMFQLISNRGITDPTIYTMLRQTELTENKLVLPTDNWVGLNVLSTSSAIDPNNPQSYDMTATLGAYRVYSKVVDTVEGNSGPDEGLLKSGVVTAGSGEVTVVSIPFLYTIEVLSQSTTNATERSKLSVLYQY